MAAEHPREEYTRRRDSYLAEEAAEARRFVQIGNVRLGVAVGAVILAWLVFGAGQLSWLWLLLPAAVFLGLVLWHDRVEKRQRHARRAAAQYERGLNRIQDRWMGEGITGERFREPHHLYADDLDIFGKGSLFELLCTARTPFGEETLARWLQHGADQETVRARQAATDELRGRVGLREDLGLLGEDIRSGLHPEQLLRWAAAPPVLFPRHTRLISFTLVGVNAVIALMLYWFNQPLTFVLPTLMMLLYFRMRLRPAVAQVRQSVEQPSHDLALLSLVLARLEQESVSSPRLAALRQMWETGGHPPSWQLARLARLMELLDSVDNPGFRPVAPLLLWVEQVTFAMEQWRRQCGPSIPQWLSALGEWEALSALAGYAYEHPADPFPELAEGALMLQAQQLGHPLLPAAQCVPNDARLDGQLRLLVVSGSNMSGKSTYLRTIGINVVLALAGAPVRAAQFRLSPFAMGASLRIQDSLQEGESRFYAEIRRLREIVDLTGGPVPVLFLLDELLSGTNSHDRQVGAEAIVRGLLARGAVGLLTTHDLALAAIAQALPGEAENVHFEDRLVDGQLRFDYRLRPGVVQRSNALELMRSVGLEV